MTGNHLAEIKAFQTRIKRTRRGAYIVEHKDHALDEHYVFGQLKDARNFKEGYNMAIDDAINYLQDFVFDDVCD